MRYVCLRSQPHDADGLRSVLRWLILPNTVLLHKMDMQLAQGQVIKACMS